MSSFVAITGATGHIGKGAAGLLLKKGVKVRAIARTVDKLKSISGAEAVAADINDVAALERAFTGADAVFAMIPPNVVAPDVRADQNRTGDNLVAAIKKAKVTHIVALSSVGAHMSEKMGPVNGLYDWEQKLKSLTGVNVLVLRPCYFMENLLMNVGLIKGNGIMGSAIHSDVRMPMIATRDIAAVVADALEKRNFSGYSVRELLGERDTTMEEVRRAVARGLAKPDLAYVEFPYADAEKAMTGMGLSTDYARLIVEMAQSLNGKIFKPSQTRDERTTTPTSVETFINDTFLPAVKGS